MLPPKDRDRDRDFDRDAPGDDGGGPGKGGGGRFPFRRKKYCKFCEDKVTYIDYKDTDLLLAYVPERAKIAPRRISGTCAVHQRKLQQAIKLGRAIALLPFTTE